MYVCARIIVCMYIHVCVQSHVYIHVVWVRASMNVGVHVQTCMYMYVCYRICINTCTLQTYTTTLLVHVHTHKCTHVCMYMYTSNLHVILQVILE